MRNLTKGALAGLMIAGLAASFVVLLSWAQGPQVGVPSGGRLNLPGGGIEHNIGTPGNSALGITATFTLLSGTFVEVANNTSRDFLDLSAADTEFRLVASMSVAAVTGDLVLQCDADPAFGSPATLGQLDNPAAGMTVGSWTAVPAGECKTAGGVYLRAGMANGNGTENPEVRFIRLQLR